MNKLVLLFLPLYLFASLQKTSIQLEWQHQFEFAGFYAAQEKGFYKEVGLDVEIKEVKKDMHVSDELINGNSHFGISSSSLILNKLQNKPVVLIASYFKQNALALVTTKDIKTIKDLKNKKLMASKYEFEKTSLAVMFAEENIHSSDYELIEQEFNPQKFINGEIDGMSVFISNQLYELDKKKIPYNLFLPSDYGIYSYDCELFTSQKFAKNNPELITNFTSATKKGWEYAFKHKEEIVDLIYTKYSSKKSKEALLYEADKIEQLFRLKKFQIGSIIPELLELNAIIYQKLGIIDKNINLKKQLSDYIFKQKSNSIFTDKEIAFIKKHPSIKVANDRFWPPFDFYENDEATGFNVDYLKEISRLTGLKFKFVQDKNWESLIEKFKNGEIDILTAFEPTPTRKEFTLFSDTILQTFESMTYRDDYPSPHSYKDLYGKRVGVIKGYDFEEEIRNNHKKINMILFNTPLEALRALTNSQIDIFLENTSVVKYLIGKHFITSLKVGASPSFPNIEDGDNIRIASRKDYPQLHSIIQKAIQNISQAKTNALKSKWFNSINEENVKYNFTEEELAFLRENRVVKIANEMDWAPFDYNEFGKPTGLSIEYIKLLFKKAGLKYEFINGYTWSELLALYKEKKVDLLPAFYKTAEREEYSLFTTPYYQGELSIFSTDDSKLISSTSDLKGKKVGIEKSDASVPMIKKYLKDSQIIEYSSTAKLFGMLESKELDAVICNPLLLKHFAEQNNVQNIKKIENIQMSHKERQQISLHIGVRDDYILLHSILQKMIDSLSKKEIERLKEEWIFKEKSKALLNVTEREYLQKKTPTICIDPNWMPFEKFEDGVHVGMSADYFKIISNHIKSDIEVIPSSTWSESLELAKKRECDILSLVMITPERSKYLNFTTPYLKTPLVLATNIEVPFIVDFQSLKDKILGIPKGYAYLEILKKQYPNLNIVEVENIDVGLNKVKRGELFGYIGTLASIGYQFQTKYIGELKIAGKFDNNWEFRIGVRNDDPILLSIMQKAIDSISQAQHREILNKWVAINYNKEMDYSLIWKILFVVTFIIALFIFWNRKLSLLNRELERAKTKAEEATQTKANFLANMSHEIRTPMNSIIGMSYLIKETKLNKTQLDYIEKIEKSSHNLLTLINNILDFSKMEIKKL
ncbi:MAG: hypothetical protein DRG78_21155, partial [Epsilonproteobacteria bacterium]